ncbi:MAG: hypothetical protein FJY77_05795 [Candidatus Altiarchaeales archaeon]|nr:hypothetical protein [Candidatus Altiarchaeales archaeon]
MSAGREVCRIIDVKYELLLTALFTLVSGAYVLQVHGLSKTVDALLLWMFPASVTMLITLLILLSLGRVYIQK